MPDMRLAIAYALDYPRRATVAYGGIDWVTLARLDFGVPDRATFRCLDLAYEAGRAGGTAPAWLSAANEIAVEAFLAGRLLWSDIARVIEDTMQQHDGSTPTRVEDILEADATARRIAQGVLK
jgi:1-deoxy-D-xylulose-5-phosphate reductoisomerase